MSIFFLYMKSQNWNIFIFNMNYFDLIPILYKNRTRTHSYPILNMNLIRPYSVYQCSKNTFWETYLFCIYRIFFCFPFDTFFPKGNWTVNKKLLAFKNFDTLYLKQTKCFISSPFQLNVAICSFSLQGRS